MGPPDDLDNINALSLEHHEAGEDSCAIRTVKDGMASPDNDSDTL